MRICYVLLSLTFGMHQYTADLANWTVQFGYDVHLVTTARYPGHRYLPAITVHTPVDTRSSGLLSLLAGIVYAGGLAPQPRGIVDGGVGSGGAGSIALSHPVCPLGR